MLIFLFFSYLYLKEDAGQDDVNETQLLLQTSTEEVDIELKRETIKVDIGSRLVLTCPGHVDMEQPVTWFNESRMIG